MSGPRKNNITNVITIRIQKAIHHNTRHIPILNNHFYFIHGHVPPTYTWQTDIPNHFPLQNTLNHTGLERFSNIVPSTSPSYTTFIQRNLILVRFVQAKLNVQHLIF